MQPVEIKCGESPIILAMPHTGTYLPEDIMANLLPAAKELRDTDWHIDKLYDGLVPDATFVRANFHRYVVDANRDPSGRSLYPGQNTTGLVPLTDFDGQPLWENVPTQDEIEQRVARYHTAYHAALSAEIARIKALHGVAILYDCHSIRSHIPRLFDGQLPDLNIGTFDGHSCTKAIETATMQICRATNYTNVLNGRFKGGWTTRHYGRPQEGVHAIQMELAQNTHLVAEEPPYELDVDKAAQLRPVLAEMLCGLETLATEMAGRE